MKSTACLLLFLLSVPLTSASADTENLLRESATAFWQANEVKDRVTAMKYVHPDDLNNFLNKKAMVIRKWEVSDISIKPGSEEAEITISYSMETYPGIAFNLKKTEQWQLIKNAWKVRVPDPAIAAKEAFLGKANVPTAGSREKVLLVRPKTIKFYQINTSQPAFIWIENYLDIPARLTVLEVDETLVKIAEQPTLIKPGEKARIKLQYIGKEQIKENQPTEVVLEIEFGDEVLKRTIPAVYNYINQAMRWIQQKQQGGQQPEE
jgi:hypothetical protein